MKARLIKEVGARAKRLIFEDGACPVCAGGYHRAETVIEGLPNDYAGVVAAMNARELFDEPGWPSACACGYLFTEAAHRSVSPERLYDTASGRPEPGDLFFEPCNLHSPCFHWDNCDGMHLHAILPTGEEWDIDSRANNCALKDERTHRCWVREGVPPDVTAGKGGHTCAAGAGSIQTARYHGFLRGGAFEP